MSNNFVLLEKASNGVATLLLNRPEAHNAFDDTIIAQLTEKLVECDGDDKVSMLVLRSNGKSFSAGADLAWMKRMAQNTREENLADAARLARLMEVLHNFSKPTIALVQGAAFGGAVGLVACCDIAIATQASKFCLSEVKIGLIPGAISPYVIRAIGEKQARRYFITAEAFNAEQAEQYGLVHEVVEDNEQLESKCQYFIEQMRKNSPKAMIAAKQLVYAVSGKAIDQTVIADTSRRIAEIRVSEEGQEGLGAFLQKRKPNWIQE